MSKYLVVAFPRGREALSRDIAFQDATLRATDESLRLLSASPHKLALAALVEVRIYPKMSIPEPIEQYDQYQSVYFLNDAAIHMCNELGLSLPIIGEVEGVPDEYGYQVRDHYLPHLMR